MRGLRTHLEAFRSAVMGNWDLEIIALTESFLVRYLLTVSYWCRGTLLPLPREFCAHTIRNIFAFDGLRLFILPVGRISRTFRVLIVFGYSFQTRIIPITLPPAIKCSAPWLFQPMVNWIPSCFCLPERFENSLRYGLVCLALPSQHSADIFKISMTSYFHMIVGMPKCF